MDFRYDVMSVYRNGLQSYLSGTTMSSSIPVNFADGTYDVYVDTGAAGRIYMLVFAIELFLCFLIWMFILTRGMRGIIRRIMVLDKDVSGMENGDLTSAITVPGNDEVARLGKSIDNSRKALLANMQKEQREAEEKKEYIRTVTHDLRTPLTVILANLELVEHAENLTESRRFLKSTEQNAASLRDMITELFDFTITESLESIQLSGPAEAEAALGDDLSNLITLLHEDHFQTVPDTMTFPNRRILYEPSYISHIMTDILSNIRKYAVPESVIHIDLEENDENVVLTVMNPIAKTAESRQGTTHLGVRNIQEMMRLMHGTGECHKDPDSGYYIVRLAFPVAGN
ncbi:MAG: HAMP domain-containing histidine kinase [Lachnospiraceae bacterium]|nr:HAMP domain-containing histidine kinase [Lachnospiraceae bacterium]MCI1334767.1 HAMP domain-containing histidine kinase [Lachnospiraceae bacterium]MCI1358859.1 HAMP domain-containing histidine kinase [Lachnospiraceae bacterium]MCI1379499.1 HAMP domain-containing histidine kinase [Lachnospiraceae bacterium]MCI1455807.1 HAMP domain-containing histidine kinase [Lachnospiraceae bacterium]